MKTLLCQRVEYDSLCIFDVVMIIISFLFFSYKNVRDKKKTNCLLTKKKNIKLS